MEPRAQPHSEDKWERVTLSLESVPKEDASMWMGLRKDLTKVSSSKCSPEGRKGAPVSSCPSFQWSEHSFNSL